MLLYEFVKKKKKTVVVYYQKCLKAETNTRNKRIILFRMYAYYTYNYSEMRVLNFFFFLYKILLIEHFVYISILTDNFSPRIIDFLTYLQNPVALDAVQNELRCISIGFLFLLFV